MAARCLIPAGFLDEARATLRRAKALYAVHFRGDAGCVRDIDELLNRKAFGGPLVVASRSSRFSWNHQVNLLCLDPLFHSTQSQRYGAKG